MEGLVVEVGFKLKNNLVYYHDLLINRGLKLDFSCITRDVYYTNKNLDGMTENEMKNSCVRIRYFQGINKEEKDNSQQLAEEKKLLNEGYNKIFDTLKIDFQYSKEGMKSKIQIQDIKDIGLIVYYDNPDYYGMALDEQRKKLIHELNTYGFEFEDSELGVDKLRTLYYGKYMFSKNQNG